MAESYLEFSEVLGHLHPDQEAWLRRQLEVVYVFGELEYPEDELSEHLDPADADWYGCRAWRDLTDYEPEEDSPVGFAWEFHDDHDLPEGIGRHLWFHSEEGGDPRRVAHLVQKFLREFRPQESWSLSYALTCSKPCPGEFGGGAVFVTAQGFRHFATFDWIEECARSLQSQQEVAGLIRDAKRLGIEAEDLDDLIHEEASQPASCTNSAGLEEQITFLAEQLAVDETRRALEQVAAEKKVPIQGDEG
jgi:hypothetical protein